MNQLPFFLKIQIALLFILFYALGISSGLLWNVEVNAQKQAIRMEEQDTPSVPLMKITEIDGQSLEFTAGQNEFRILFDDHILSIPPLGSETIELSMLPTPVIENISLMESECNFAARSTGSVYYIASSSEGRAIPTEKLTCFRTTEEAESEGYAPSKSIKSN